MTKNPVLNALGASVYIVLVVSLMTYITKTQGEKPDTVVAPILFLSLLTLSAAVMVFIFFYQPAQLLVEGKRKQATNLFVRTIGAFGVITILVSILLFSGLI